MVHEMTRTGLLRGAAFGGAVVMLVVAGTVIKGVSSGDWEVLEWTGLMLILGGFPLSLLLTFAEGGWGFFLLVFAVIANWALLGGMGGLVVDLIIARRP